MAKTCDRNRCHALHLCGYMFHSLACFLIFKWTDFLKISSKNPFQPRKHITQVWNHKENFASLEKTVYFFKINISYNSYYHKLVCVLWIGLQQIQRQLYEIILQNPLQHAFSTYILPSFILLYFFFAFLIYVFYLNVIVLNVYIYINFFYFRVALKFENCEANIDNFHILHMQFFLLLTSHYNIYLTIDEPVLVCYYL